MTTIIIPQYETSRIRTPLQHHHQQQDDVVVEADCENDTQDWKVNPLVRGGSRLSDASSSSSDNSEIDDSSFDDAWSYSIMHERFDEHHRQQQDENLSDLHSQWSSRMFRRNWFGCGILVGLIIQLITLSSIITRHYHQQILLNGQQQHLQSHQDLNDSTETQTTVLMSLLSSHLDLILYTIIWLAFTLYLGTSDNSLQQLDHRTTKSSTTRQNNETINDNHGFVIVSFFNFLFGLVVGSNLVWIVYNNCCCCQYFVNNIEQSVATTILVSSTRISWLSMLQTILVDGTVCFVTVLYATSRRKHHHHHDLLFENSEKGCDGEDGAQNTTIMMIL